MAEPAKLGRYEIRGVLGEGAMGVVYKGYDLAIERIVAIKTVRRELDDSPVAAQIVERFKNEAKAAGRLVHPNIVGVYEYGEDGSNAFIVMEYVEGTGLRDYLSRHADLGLRQVVAIMKQLLLALDFAHQRGVIHRDIKPTNLILTAEGTLKLADFGIAHIDMSNLTISGTVLGTPSYMSPEQIQGRTIDGRSDLFSAGVVLYELLTGESPFVGSLTTIAYKICHEDPVPPSRFSGSKLPPLVDEVVARALAKHPEARFQTAREFSDALEKAFETPPAEVKKAYETSADIKRAFASSTTEITRTLQASAPSIANVNVKVPPPAAPSWDATVLSAAERKLAKIVGPMASVMVRKAAAQTGDPTRLYALLAENIADPEGRRRFLEVERPAAGTGPGTRSGSRTVTGGTPPTPTPTPIPQHSGGGDGPTRASTGPLEPAFVDQAAAKLAVYLGPIAGWVTKKAAAQATSREELVRILAGQLGAQERRAFLRDLGFPEA